MKLTPSRRWHFLSAALFLVFAVGEPLLVIRSVVRHWASGKTVLVPGSHALQIEKPGRQVIWNVISAFHEGTQYTFAEALPSGMRIRILDIDRNREIPTTASTGLSEESGAERRVTICRFEADRPGTYTLVVDGTAETRLLMVRPGMTGRTVLTLLAGSFLALVGWVVAPLISLLVELARYRAKRKAHGITA